MARWLRRFAWLLAACTLALVVPSWRALGGRAPAEVLARSPRWNGSSFQNLVPTHELLPGRTGETLRRQLFGDEPREPAGTIPVVRPTAAQLRAAPASGLRVTWIGHATALVEIDGARILTDPIWSERCSPHPWLGPRRFHPPPISLDALGAVDAAVVSHDHYDHLDMATVKRLAAGGTRFFVPLGVGAHLTSWDVPAAQVTELDWGGSGGVRGVRITALPARHYSGRVFTRNRTLWASWSMAGPRHRAWFSGDTGWFEGMREIGARHGPFDVAIVKIGAYGETWPEIHATPEEAVLIHQAVGGRVLFPVHWATFNLAFHAWREPAERLVASAADRATVVVPRPGEMVEPATPPPLERWWAGL